MTTQADAGNLMAFGPAASSTPGGAHISDDVHVERLGSWAAAARLEHLWNDLLEDSASRTVFLTWEWLTSWWHTYGGSRQLMILTCMDRSGALLGIAPLYRDRKGVAPGLCLRVLRFIGDGTHDSDNLDFIARRGAERAAIQAFARWLDDHRREWDVLELNTLPAESPSACILLEACRARRWYVRCQEAPRALLRLPADASVYVASLSESMRSTIRNRTRHLERNHRVRFVRCENPTDLSCALHNLFRLNDKRWSARGQAAALAESPRRTFLEEATKRLQLRGWLDLWTLEVDGDVVATELGFRYGDTCSFLQAGFDPDWYSKNVGIVLRARILRHLIDSGIRYYDFLAGDDSYKFRWGADRLGYLSLRCAPRSSRGGFVLRLGVVADSTKEAVRRHTPAGAWSLSRQAFRWFRPSRA